MSVKDVFFMFAVLSLLAPALIQAAGLQSAGLRFFGKPNSHAEYESWNARPNATLQFFFQTNSKKTAMLFYQDDNGQSQFMDLFLIKGEARFRARNEGMRRAEERFIKRDFADSKWHQVKIELSEKEITFSIDTEDFIYNAMPIAFDKYVDSSENAGLFVGGIPLEDRRWSHGGLFYDVYG